MYFTQWGKNALSGAGRLPVAQRGEVEKAIEWAIEAGYRHIDTAAAYHNETGVGVAVASAPVPREELFIVSKVWNTDQGYDNTMKAFETSLNKLDLEYLDLYLVHWPVPGKYKETWRAMERLYAEKRVRAIGVCNFLQHHLYDLFGTATVIPMVNQVEFHPYLVQQELLSFCKAHAVQYEGWSPLMQGTVFGLESLGELAARYDKSIAQVVLRWDLQKGVVTIPKSVHKDRIRENADLFDFELLPEDIAFLDSLDRGKRFGPDPDNFDF